MSFPGTLSSQLTAVMEALLKAVVAQVTAVVEDRVVELRLQLRDRDRELMGKQRHIELRDREILEKQRDIELRDREILQLRAVVEELRAREEEEEEAVIAVEERAEEAQSCSQVWTKEEEEEEDDTDSECVMKWEPNDFLISPSILPAHLSASADVTASTSTNTAAEAFCSNDTSSTEPTHTFSSPETQDFANPGRGTKELFPSTSSSSGYRCDQCGKTFTGKKRLITHQTVHTGARPYGCPKCGQRFTRSDSLVRHLKLDSCCKVTSLFLDKTQYFGP
ncbi:unnamed protein product [Knipowitschia caucasica]|uniref:C2H2-type domain-containing protein n=1 Tax=Knipowitschia caucasica TaxID=637954 RepID=A0AAV2JS83_KNICA